MNAKIDWYKEVLEIEPSSKVFFPLAKLFLDNGQLDEALITLQQGLEKHPEHFEARMLLVDVLRRSGMEDESRQHASEIAQTMTDYPSFWQCWAAILSGSDDGADSSLALRYLAAHFSGASISWTSVIERGLSGILGEALAGAAAQAPASAEAGSGDVHAAQEHVEPAATSDEEELPGAESITVGVVGEDTLNALRELSSGEDSLMAGGFEEDDAVIESEEISVRTRTMADLLVEQGDMQGALDIYRELCESCPPGAEKDSLQDRIRSLEVQMGAGGSRKSESKEPVQGRAGARQSKLLVTLEALANRLEARAAGVSG